MNKSEVVEGVIKSYNELKMSYENLKVQIEAQDDTYLTQLLAEAQTTLASVELEKAKQNLDKILVFLESVEKKMI